MKIAPLRLHSKYFQYNSSLGFFVGGIDEVFDDEPDRVNL